MPEYWTRVISISRDHLQQNLCYPLNSDMMLCQNLPRSLNNLDEEGWKPFFLPKDFVLLHLGIQKEHFQLSEEALMLHGKEITALRKSFREKAER